MKKYLFAFVLTIAVSIASAQPPAGPPNQVMYLGTVSLKMTP